MSAELFRFSVPAVCFEELHLRSFSGALKAPLRVEGTPGKNNPASLGIFRHPHSGNPHPSNRTPHRGAFRSRSTRTFLAFCHAETTGAIPLNLFFSRENLTIEPAGAAAAYVDRGPSSIHPEARQRPGRYVGHRRNKFRGDRRGKRDR